MAILLVSILIIDDIAIETYFSLAINPESVALDNIGCDRSLKMQRDDDVSLKICL